MSSPERPIWCPRCEIHLALPYQKLCPVCLDEARKDKS